MTSDTPLDARGLPRNYRLQDQWELTPRQVKARLDAGEDLVLIDCRTPAEHAVARIDKAVLAPLQAVGSKLAELEAYADRPIVTICHLGMRSLRLAAILREQGFEDVKSMAGGIDLWARDIDPEVPRY